MMPSDHMLQFYYMNFSEPVEEVEEDSNDEEDED
jgi:hypothetical protein